MRTRPIVFCALAFMAGPTYLCAQKTEVTVRRGKVQAETQTATVDINAGQKAVLTDSADPVVTVDDPLVHDALDLYKLAEKEKEHGELNIDSTLIMVGRWKAHEVVAAIYFEVPNPGPKATKILTIPYASTLGDFRVYDLSGNLCRVEERSLGNFAFAYSIHFSEQVQPGEHFKLSGVMSLNDMPLLPGGAPSGWREGPLLYFRSGNNSPNALNYFRFILPASAILVDSTREIVATDTVDGQLAVTMRNYTGPYCDGMCIIAFLYPDEDGTTLADVPGKYLGLVSRRDKQNSEMFRRGMRETRVGKRYTDQSTPLAALLTCLGSIMDKDVDLYTKAKYTEQSPESIRGHLEQAAYFADILDLLSTPPWPENPGNGYVHPIYLCRKGSKIDEFTQPMVYENGQWYAHDTKSKEGRESKAATPSETAAAKAEGYLCDWEVAGPYIQKGKTYKELFDIPFGPELPDVNIPWQRAAIEPHEEYLASVNLDDNLMHFDQSVAYLRTEIVSDRQKTARLEIYTDDGVKAWLNGQLVHANNVSRGIPEQPDTVDVTLKQGVNELMLKVTDDVAAWGAVARVRPTDAEADQN
jgi:hypothetical protein